MARKALKKSPPKKKVQAKKPAKKAAPRKASRPAAPKAAARPKWKSPSMGQDVIASLVLRDAAGAIEFYKRALGAEELGRHTMPGSTRIMHAEIRIGDTVIALNDEMDMPGPHPVTAAGPNHKPTNSFMLYTPDCDALFNRAVAAGAQPMMPLADQFWGDRMGGITDPFGQCWMIATHQKDLSMDELTKAGEQFAAQMAGQAPPAAASQ